MPPHKGQVRYGWRKLSSPYRARLERQGVDQRSWEDGADLRRARGKQLPRPRGAAPADLVTSVVKGEASVSDLRSLGSRFTRPSWIPASMSIDAQAALSQLPNPKRWAAVRFEPKANGEPWTMIVTPKGSPLREDGTSPYDISILIPGGGGPESGARQILDLVTQLESKKKTTSQAEAIRQVFLDIRDSA